MEKTTEQLDTQITALAVEAFSAFCEDITGMFGVTAECSEYHTGSGSFDDIKKSFKKLVSINHVEAKGTLEGNCNLIFDQAGTFIIAGVFVMLPEKRILEYVQSGTTKDTDFINDAIKEVGNLLVGSWDRIYREELQGHKHFKQSGTFVGNITGDSEIEGFSLDEGCFYAICEMVIDNFSKFKCAAVFPNSILEAKPEPEPTEEESPQDSSEESEAEDAVVTEETAEETTETATTDEPASETEETTEETAETATVEESVPETDESTEDETAETATVEESVPEADESTEDETAETATVEESVSETNEATENEAAEKTETAEVEQDGAEEPQPQEADSTEGGPVTEAIQQMTQQSASACTSLNPGQHNLANICAKQVMNPAVLWADPEDTIEHMINQMQQHNTGYVLVGKDLQIEGIASRSDIASAVSPYTRSVFSHWRRPLDDASLQIRIKWFMTRPVQTIAPDTSLEVVIHTMSKHGIRGLPVVDSNGLVMGLITVFDIFQALTGKDTIQGQTQQAPPLCNGD